MKTIYYEMGPYDCEVGLKCLVTKRWPIFFNSFGIALFIYLKISVSPAILFDVLELVKVHHSSENSPNSGNSRIASVRMRNCVLNVGSKSVNL